MNIKARGLGDKNEYFSDLLQLTLRNEMYVFNLDVSKNKRPIEVHYVHGIDMLIDQDNFVNLGLKD